MWLRQPVMAFDFSQMKPHCKISLSLFMHAGAAIDLLECATDRLFLAPGVAVTVHHGVVASEVSKSEVKHCFCFLLVQ